MYVEIMDTTLRDGEQTSGVSFTAREKLGIARYLLEELKADRIEVASARVSEGEFDAVKRIIAWAGANGYLDRVEVLSFVDGGASLEWIVRAGARVVNLLCKGSAKHLEYQLKKTPGQHLADIESAIGAARTQGMKVNVYLEDWSNGMLHSPDYVYFLLEGLSRLPVERIMIPDTLGILDPFQTYELCKQVVDRYPDIRFDFHAHNDYDLSVGNSLAAVKAGCRGLHTTVNGLGERAGNAPLSSIVPVLKDFTDAEVGVDEGKITRASRLVETFSGIRIPANKPIIGENVYTQACGVHADGDNKGNLYFNDLLPERFGRVRKYALGKTSGKSNIRKNLEELGIELDAQAMAKVTQRVIELGDRKESVTADDLPYIISDVLNSESIEQKIKILNYVLTVAEGLKSAATLKIEIDGTVYQQTSIGDGQYNAFMNALHRVFDKLGQPLPVLLDYVVTIPPGGKTDALVETVITWKDRQREYKTKGLDPDQTVAAIKATVKMLNIMGREM